MKSLDKKNKLKENPFRYNLTKSQKILIHWENKLIKTLSGKDALKFIAKIEGKTDYEIQFELAKITGNFKHGNERDK